MIRRDFLKTLAAFSAAAAGGGSAVAAAMPAAEKPKVLTPEQVASNIRWMPSKVDLHVVRGDDFFVDFDLPKCPLSITSAWFFDPAGTLRGNFFVRKSGDSLTRLELPASHTARVRPRSFSWVAVDAYRNAIIAGKLTVLPDDLWKAEESVLDVARQLLPMGVARVGRYSRNDHYEVGLRERLRPDETSMYSNRLESLVEHARPTSCQIINRGMGALVYFEPRGLV